MSSSQRGGALFGNAYGDTFSAFTDRSRFSFPKLKNDYANYITDTGVSSGVIQYLYYFIMLTVIILLILVLIHYLYTPIFILKPGSKGYIHLPGSDDSELFWKTSNDIKSISDTKTPIGTSVQNYSFLLDFQIDNPTANTQSPRVLLVRGAKLNPFSGTYSAQDTIQKVLQDFNVIVYLDRITNDLNICVQTAASASTNYVYLENILVPNIPIRKPIRLGVMVGSKVLEVYINGFLVRSITYMNPLKDIVGEFQPPLDNVLSATAQVRNLRLWNRVISPAEFRYYGKSDVNFDIKDIPDSCLS